MFGFKQTVASAVKFESIAPDMAICGGGLRCAYPPCGLPRFCYMLLNTGLNADTPRLLGGVLP
jgi:hypothetical protein